MDHTKDVESVYRYINQNVKVMNPGPDVDLSRGVKSRRIKSTLKTD